MKVLKKPLSVLLSLMMLLGMISMLGSVSFAAVDNSKLLAQFFANKNDYWGLWNDNALRSTLDSQWLNGGQGDISYNHDLRMAYLDKVALQINTENGNLFDGVNRNTGVTFAFNYRPNFTGNHRHILSIGKNAYGSGVASHFFISGSTAHNSSGHFPIVEWVNEAGTETIKAYPQDVVPVVGREYNIVIKVDKDDGIIFYIDGIQQTTVYVDGENLNDVRAFLDEVSTYTKNYIGCSRWTDDAKIEGYLSDFRIYGSSMTDAEACSLVADMAVFNPADNPYAAPENAPFFDFSKPTFNAIGYFCDEEAVGGYNNLAYSSRQVNYKGTDLSNSYGVSGINFKIITSQNTIMVYDGVSGHEPAAPIEVETKVDSKKDRVINYIASADSNLTLVQDWKGRIDYQWTWWVPNHTNDGSYVNESFSYYNGGSASPIQDNTGTSRFWWNKLQYNGGMNENTYLLAVINPKFDISAKYNSTSNTGSIESVANYYILNYKPVYDVLTNAASEYSAMAESKWMYTEESYLQAMLAMRRLTLCSPSYCDYKSADISLEAEARANAIEQAITSYKNINLVKKQAKVNINVGEGTSITVTYNDGTIKTVTDGTYVDYGNVLNVTAAALEGYDQNSPVVTISDESSRNTTSVNRAEITISTAALPKNTYKVEFNANGGENAPNAITITHGEKTNLPADKPARTGYDFLGWATADNATVQEYEAGGEYTGTSAATLYAVWSAKSYTLTFDYNDETGIGEATPKDTTEISVAYDSELKTLPTPTRNGYKFKGWKVEGTDTVLNNGNKYQIADNKKLIAQWELITYTITFDLKNGEFTDPDFDGAPITYNIEEDVEIPNPVKEGYTFSGWQVSPVLPDTWATINWLLNPEDDEIDNTESHKFSKGKYGNIKLTAQGTIDEYTITFDYNTEKLVLSSDTPIVPDESKVTYGDKVELPSSLPTIKGYEFAGWFFEDTCETPYEEDYIFTKDTTLYALWNAIKYTVMFDANDGVLSADSSKLYTIEDTVQLFAPTREGHTFTGWTVTSNEDNNWNQNIAASTTSVKECYGNVTLTAQWKINEYTVTFVDGNGKTLKTETVKYGSAATAPTETPEKDRDDTNHYIFNGWDTNFDQITAETKVTATFTAETHESKKVIDSAVAPSCTVDGKTEGSHCSVCEYVIKAQETDPKTGHHYNEPVFVWGVNGKVTVTATCEKNDDTKTLTAKVDSERTSEPTCTEKGTILYTATVEFENETYTSTHEEDIPANEHEYDDLVFDWDDEGNVNVTATCIYNDDTLTYEAEVTSERTEPTCTEKGKIVYTAKVVIDDEIYTSNHEVDIPAAGHDWEAKFTWTPKAEGGYDVTAKRVCKTDPNHEESAENVIVDSKITKYPTSAEEGEKEYTATATFSDAAYTDKKTDKIEKLNQDYEFVGFEWSADNTSATVVVKDKNNGNAEVRFPADMSSEKHEPTCTEKGKTVYTATYGGNSESKTVYDESEEGKALGHSYTIVEANTDGTHTLTCDRCEEGTEEHSSIVKCSEGEPITENKVPSTCKEAGKYDEVVYCTVCKAELSRDSKTIDKLAHTPGDMVVENEVSPTCQKEGSYDEVICCTVCGEVTSRITKTIEKTSHTPGEAVVENKKAATCAAEGSYDEVVYCTVCGEEISGSRTTITLPIDKTAHVWSDWTVVTPATPTSDGTERRICSVCGETEERTIQISGEKSRQIQFVVTSGMHYVVHMEKDYTVSGKSARALYWYNDVDLNFEVVTGAGWGYDRYFVQVNGTILEPNDDGTYTLPGGTGYAQINVTPVIVTPSGGSSNTTECKYCGKLHPVTLWGRIVAFFHAIFYWIKSLFSK